MPKSLDERMNNDFVLLIKLENDMQPVRDLIREKRPDEAAQICEDLLNKQHGSFVVKYRKFIEPMVRLDPDEYMEWITQKKKHYVYNTYLTLENHTPIKLPTIISNEHVAVQPYTPIKKEGNI